MSYTVVGQPDSAELAQHIAAEMSVLGAMMSSPDVIDDVQRMLDVEDFERGIHRCVYTAISELHEQGQPADALTVGGQLYSNAEFLRNGGLPYLHTLLASVQVAANATFYADQVRDAADARLYMEITRRGQAMVEAGFNGRDLLDRAATDIADLQARRAAADTGWTEWGQVLTDAVEDAEAIATGQRVGLKIGYTDLDHVTTGLHPGQLVTVAARPGGGKSAVITDIARNVAFKQHIPVLAISLEMSKIELGQRVTCAEAQVNINAWRGGWLTNADWTRIAAVQAATAGAPLMVTDVTTRSITDIAAMARQVKRQSPDLGVIVLDYLQLVQPPAGLKTENRQQEVSAVSRALKLLAQELQVPIVVAAQLNRGSAQRADERPKMSDLRESGAIEQDSDIVVLIHQSSDEASAGEADFLIEKNRFGPKTRVTVAQQLHFGRFVDMAPPSQSPAAQPASSAQSSGTAATQSSGRAWIPRVVPGAGAAAGDDGSALLPQCAGCRQVMTAADSTAEELDAGVHVDCAEELGS